MIVCSFLPAVTQMIYDMGLQEYLYGVTFECPSHTLAEKPPVVRCLLEGKSYSSQEIDTIFSASKQQGSSLYYIDESLLQKIMPDVVFTQDVCEVCQIDTACTQQAVSKLPKQPTLVPISPQSLDDVFHAAITIARAMGKEEAAYSYLAGLKHRQDHLIDQQRAHQLPPKRVSLLEWLAPIYNCGHWIPYQIARAGGIDMLSNPGGDSIVTDWEKIRRYNPEVLVVAPCGFKADRTVEEMEQLTALPGWKDIQAVKDNAVYVLDFDLFTQPSASTLVDGIEMLASVFYPEYFKVPIKLEEKKIHYTKIKT